MTVRQRIRALWQMVIASLRTQYMYRMNMVIGIFFAGMSIYLLTRVWTAAYKGQTSVDGISLEQMLVYLTIANLQLYFLQSDMAGDMQGRVREGQIGFDVSRPISYPSQLLANGLGTAIGKLPFLLVAVPIALLFGELRPPPTTANSIGYALSLALAWVIAQQLAMLIGMVAFWTLESTGFMMMYRLISTFATGALIPFWFMPDPLVAILRWLPFQSIAYVPVSIYVGHPATGSIPTALALQGAWVVALVLIARVTWTRALDKTVVQGG